MTLCEADRPGLSACLALQSITIRSRHQSVRPATSTPVETVSLPREPNESRKGRDVRKVKKGRQIMAKSGTAGKIGSLAKDAPRHPGASFPGAGKSNGLTVSHRLTNRIPVRECAATAAPRSGRAGHETNRSMGSNAVPRTRPSRCFAVSPRGTHSVFTKRCQTETGDWRGFALAR